MKVCHFHSSYQRRTAHGIEARYGDRRSVDQSLPARDGDVFAHAGPRLLIGPSGRNQGEGAGCCSGSTDTEMLQEAADLHGVEDARVRILAVHPVFVLPSRTRRRDRFGSSVHGTALNGSMVSAAGGFTK